MSTEKTTTLQAWWNLSSFSILMSELKSKKEKHAGKKICYQVLAVGLQEDCGSKELQLYRQNDGLWKSCCPAGERHWHYNTGTWAQHLAAAKMSKMSVRNYWENEGKCYCAPSTEQPYTGTAAVYSCSADWGSHLTWGSGNWGRDMETKQQGGNREWLLTVFCCAWAGNGRGEPVPA